MNPLRTARLALIPITLPLVEAVFRTDRAAVEKLTGASVPPEAWPGKALVERAFTASLDLIRADPAGRLWGDRLMIDISESRIVGSVIFHGAPDPIEQACEVGYGVELASQGRGYATEALLPCLEWAEEQGVKCIRATTLPWHKASVRVLEKCGFTSAGTRAHEVLAELLLFERWSKSEA